MIAWAGCSPSEQKAPSAGPDSWEGVCIDSDGDGHGFQCEAGEDCDDGDATIFEGCLACSKPNEGCECEPTAQPVDCTLPKEITETGTL